MPLSFVRGLAQFQPHPSLPRDFWVRDCGHPDVIYHEPFLAQKLLILLLLPAVSSRFIVLIYMK